MASTDGKRLKAAAKARQKAAKAARKRPIVGVNQLSPRDFQRWKDGEIR